MSENSQIKQQHETITKLQADLAHAYQIINDQQAYIEQLQAQLSPNSTKYPQRDISKIPTKQSNIVSGKPKTRYQVKKRVLPSQKKSGKLSQLQFASIVAIVVLLMTVVGFALMRRPDPNPSSKSTNTRTSQPTTEPNATVPQAIKSFPAAPNFTPIPENTLPVSIPAIASRNTELPELVYNVQTPPKFRKSQALQSIVDDAVNLAIAQGLPKQRLSITLINANNLEYAEYQQKKQRFPASVVKMFWMVYLYAQIEKGIWNEADFGQTINDMIKRSDNNSASYILDATTQTQSSKNLSDKEYQDWLNHRQQVNRFFQKAGYEKININQKTFPITYQKIYEPEGADLRMRGNPQDPIRNKITTYQAARLLYEIYTQQAVNQFYSQKMINLLSIDAATRIAKRDQQDPNEFNPVRGYFSESLPTDVDYGGKAGWTSGSRQEAAHIVTRDGKTAYILVVFGEDRAYAYNYKIFPKISELVFQRMRNE